MFVSADDVGRITYTIPINIRAIIVTPKVALTIEIPNVARRPRLVRIINDIIMIERVI